jgi:hypothetical protein
MLVNVELVMQIDMMSYMILERWRDRHKRVCNI